MDPKLEKVYHQYIEGQTIDFAKIPVNDNLLENRIDVLSRPILSLEGFGVNFDFSAFWLQVFLQLDRNIDYLCGEFNFSDDEFKKVIREFTKGWYYGEIFVAYGTKYINLELEAASRNPGAYDPCKLDKICKWRLYRRTRTNEGTFIFHSVLSGVPDVKLNLNELVRVAYEGMGIWVQWFELIKEYVAGMSAYLKLLKLSITRFKLTCKDPKAKQRAAEDIAGWGLFFEGDDNIARDPDVEAVEYCLPEHPDIFLSSVLKYYAEGCRRMGFVYNADSQSERVTSGEHYRALKNASNVQNAWLQIMQGFCRDLREKFKEAPPLEITLAYDVTGQGIPDNNKRVKDKWRFEGDKDKSTPKFDNAYEN